MFAFIFSMQYIPFGEEKKVIWNDFKMHVYTHTHKGRKKKTENMIHGYHKQAKQQNILSCAIYHGKQANDVIQFLCHSMHNI